MNAKQIADELENIYWIQGDGKGKPFQQYADFVRQQQAEIEALKAKTLTEDTECQYCKQGCIRCDARKLLTNEEIINIAKEHIHQRLEGERFGYVDFARAILRKASEKCTK